MNASFLPKFHNFVSVFRIAENWGLNRPTSFLENTYPCLNVH